MDKKKQRNGQKLMTEASDVEKAVGFSSPNLSGFVRRRTYPRILELIPGTRTSDRAYHKMLRDMSERLARKWPLQEAVDGIVSLPGVVDDFAKLRSLQGMLPNPAGAPPIDAERNARAALAESGQPEVQQYAATGQLSPQDEFIFAHLLDEWCGAGEPISFSLKIGATFGAPYFSSDMEIKNRAVADWADCATQRKFGSWIEAAAVGRRVGKVELAGAPLCLLYTNGYRTQLNACVRDGNGSVTGPKPRSGPDWSGEIVDFDMHLSARFDPDNSDDVYAARSRTVLVAPNGPMVPVRVIAKSADAYLKHKFKFMLLHRGIPDLLIKIAKALGIDLFDVQNHDQNIAPKLLRRALDRLADVMKLPDWARYLIQAIPCIPQLVRDDYRGGQGACLRGMHSPFDIKGMIDGTFPSMGNPSGNPLTSWIAKLFGVFYSTCAAVRAGVIRLDKTSLSQYWEGTHPEAALLNAGDNCANLAFTPRAVVAIRRIKTSCPMALLKPSETFLGNVFVRRAGGNLDIIPNLPSLAFRWFGHDHDLAKPSQVRSMLNDPIALLKEGLPDRAFWPQGWFSRITDNYAVHPECTEFVMEIDSIVKAYFGRSMSELAEASKFPMPSSLKPADRAFLERPDRIDFDPAISEEDIDPVLLARYRRKVILADVPALRSFITY